jgi:hypothetical protein
MMTRSSGAVMGQISHIFSNDSPEILSLGNLPDDSFAGHAQPAGDDPHDCTMPALSYLARGILLIDRVIHRTIGPVYSFEVFRVI